MITICPHCGRKYLELNAPNNPVLLCTGCGKEFTVPQFPAGQQVTDHLTSALATQWQPGTVILELYEVKSILGEGGFGTVYRLYHKVWRTDLAVKRPKLASLMAVGGIESLEREAEAWVNLGLHPHIVNCHYIRRIENVPHIFAEYVSGGSLAEWIKQRKLYTHYIGNTDNTLVLILDIAIQVAWGLHYAHERGLIHQDVKPANIMLTSDGTAKVADFGLARACLTQMADSRDNTNNTMIIKGMGMTRAYASPEQMQGKLLTRRTDLWSWAVLVLEMLVGERTWQAGTVAPVILAQYKQGAFDTLTTISQIPDPLVHLLQGCLHENPKDRPQTLREVARALTQIYQRITGMAYPRPEPQPNQETASNLNNRAISLLDFDKQEAAEELWQQALKIHPHHLEATYNYGLMLWRSARLTDQELIEKLEEAQKSHTGKWLYYYLLASVHLERGAADLVLSILNSKSVGITNYPEISAVLQEARKCLAINRNIATEGGDKQKMAVLCADETVAFTKNKQFVVTAKLITENHYRFRVWGIEKSSYLQTFEGYHSNFSMIALSEDTQYVLTGSKEGLVKLWVAQTGRCLCTLKISVGVNAVAFSYDGKHLFIRDANGTLRRRPLTAIVSPYSARFCLSQVRTLSVIQSAQKNYQNYLKDAKLALAQNNYTEAASRIRWARTQPDYSRGQEALDLWRQLYLCLPRNALKGIWEVSAWQGHSDAVIGCVAFAKSAFAFSAGCDKKIKLWQLNRAQYVNLFKESQEPPTRLVLSDNDQMLLLISSREDKTEETLSLYAVGNGHCLFKHKIHGKISAVALESRGRFALLGYTNSVLELIELQQGCCLQTFKGDVHDRGTGERLAGLDKHTSRITAVALSPDFRHVFVGDYGGTLKLWEIASGRCLFTIHEYNPIHAVAVSADGRHGLSSHDDNTLKLWDLKTSHCQKIFSGHTNIVTTVAFSKEGRYIVSGSLDTTVKLWEIQSGYCLYTLKYRSAVRAVTLSADNSYIFAGYECGTLRLWFLDWELAEPGIADWDEGTEPYLDMFYNQHIPFSSTLPTNRAPTPRELKLALKPRKALSSWNENDFKELLHTLRCTGYGWLQPQQVKAKLQEKMEAHRRRLRQEKWKKIQDTVRMPLPGTLIILLVGILLSAVSTAELITIAILFFTLSTVASRYLETDFTFLPLSRLFKQPTTWMFIVAFLKVVGL